MSIISAKSNHGGRVNLYLTCLVLGIVAATFFSPIWDSDFFWHLATGRWIVQNMTLPERDPFTPFFYGTEREALILKGYWLAQVCYHFVYSLCGTFGLALFKSATFVTIFAIGLYYHQGKKTPFPWVLLCLLPLYETLLSFRADRPNMLSLLFFAALLYLLEGKRWKLLPLLMLVWANAHGGYLLGDVVILLYVGALALRQRQEISPLVAGWALLAVGASFINPLGITPLMVMLKFEGSAYQQTVFEYMSPIRIALEFHDYYRGYFMALLLAAMACLFCRKSLYWPQLAVLLLTVYISLQHARYMPFFVITCAFFLPCIYSRITLSVVWGRSLFYGSAVLILLLFGSDLVEGRSLSGGLEVGIFPEKAGEFISQSGVTGRVFCDDAWGGYLLWRLPGAAVLSDTRALSEEVCLRNLKILNTKSTWEKDLLALDTTIIVSAAFNPVSGKANSLWWSLNNSQNWQLAYTDDVSLVYFRKDVSYSGLQMDLQEKQATTLNHALAQVRTFVAKYPQTPWHWGDLGKIHVLRGETKEAVQAYRKALELDPGNNDYRTKLKILESVRNNQLNIYNTTKLH